jgi:putative DNA primase/helicase
MIGGYCLCGETNFEKFFIFRGAGGNGKSVLGETWLTVWGDYAINTDYFTWVTGSRTNWGMARLPGRRMYLCSEVPKDSQLNVTLVKNVASGDRLTAEAKYQEPFEFEPQGKLIFLCNHIPNITDFSNAMPRRMVIIPFNFTTTPQQKDVRLKAKILAESSGVLNRLLEGYYMVMEDQFTNLPAPVLEENREHLLDVDWLSAFLESEFIIDDRGKVSNKEIQVRYENWAMLKNERVERSIRIILKALKEKGYSKSHTKEGDFIKGLRLKPDTDAAVKVENFQTLQDNLKREQAANAKGGIGIEVFTNKLEGKQ